jgi:membrane associated rhomboid family serine protease
MFTTVIVLITALVSIGAFNNLGLLHKFMFHPYLMIDHKQEWHRFFTHSLIHADWMHLIFNCLALYTFGVNLEYMIGTGSMAMLYISGVVISCLPAFNKHKDNNAYRALGASGGVSAVIFASIILAPWKTIYLYFIPVPAIVFAVIYLVYCVYMSKRGTDHVAHDTHFFGSIYGLLFMVVFKHEFISMFFQQLRQGPPSGFFN